MVYSDYKTFSRIGILAFVIFFISLGYQILWYRSQLKPKKRNWKGSPCLKYVEVAGQTHSAESDSYSFGRPTSGFSFIDDGPKVAIIIPYRDRASQLRGFLSHMQPVWRAQNLDYTLYIVQQKGTDLFNRGKLLNIGFMEASKDLSYECFVFHDVDILLEDERCTYSCHGNRSEVKHLSAFLDKYNYALRKYGIRCRPSGYPYNETENFGGVLMMSRTQFIEVNGFSNLFWGWGGEDDDMFLRVWNTGFTIVRSALCQFCMFKHDRGERNNLKHRMHNVSFVRQNTDGLSSLRYEVISILHTPNYINITVDIGTPSKKMLELFWQRKRDGSGCDGSIFLNRSILW